jgi:predicted ribosome quality control (RQC) complex YloA/Tae2 family protein
VEGQPWEPPPGRAGGAEAPPLADALAEAGSPVPAEGATRGPHAPLSAALEALLTGALAGRDDARARKDLAQRVDRRLARARSLRAGLAQRRAAAESSDRVRRDGELLLASLGQLKRGMESVELPDWSEEGAPPRRIALDPKRDPKENAERMFVRAKKLERSVATLEREEQLATEREAELEQLKRRLAEDGADPESLAAEAEERGLLPARQEAPKRKAKPARRLPYRAFSGSAGGDILVGRTARDNDELTLRVARGNDLWLHTADAPGSHVILRLARGAEPDKDELLEAAELALHFSPLRGARKADIHVARRKEVHKPRGAKPGLVTLSGGRVLQLRSDPARLRTLLGSRGRAEDSGEAGRS